MTREVAIKELQRHMQEFAHDHGWANSTLDALQMAIEDMQRCQRIDNKLANAVPTKWPAEGFFDFEDDDEEENV